MVILQCTNHSLSATNNETTRNDTNCIQKYNAQNPWNRPHRSGERTKKEWNGAP